jgi:Flp pilus assembly pilin Flp
VQKRKVHLTTALHRVHHVGTEVSGVRPCLSKELTNGPGGAQMSKLFRRLWSEDTGQDIAEYAVMLAVILVLVVGTVRLIGSNANNAFSSVASSLQ